MPYRDPKTKVLYPSKDYMFQKIANLPEVQQAYPEVWKRSSQLTAPLGSAERTKQISTQSQAMTQPKKYLAGSPIIPIAEGGYTVQGTDKVFPKGYQMPSNIARQVGGDISKTRVIKEITPGFELRESTPGGSNFYMIDTSKFSEQELQKYYKPKEQTGYSVDIYDLSPVLGSKYSKVGVEDIVRYNPQGETTFFDPSFLEQPNLEGQFEPPDLGRIDPVTGETLPPEGYVEPLFQDFDFEEQGIIDTTDEREAEVQQEQKQKKQEVKEAEEVQAQTEKEEAEIKSLERQKKLKDLKVELGLEEAEAPKAPELKTTYETLRSEKGLGAIEEQLNTLSQTIRDTEASLRQGLYDQEGKLRPMELIGTRQRELARQGQEQLDTLNRQKQTLVDEYNTKLNLINSIMGYTQQDFANAQTEYQTKFSNSLQLLDIVMGEEQREEDIKRSEEQREEDIAREERKEAEKQAQANWNVLLGTVGEALKSGAVTSYAELPADQQTMLRKLELQAGIPEGMTEAVLGMVQPEKNIKSVITSTDKTQVSMVYDDGTIETFDTGLTPEVEPQPKVSQTELLKNASSTMFSKLEGVVDKNGFVTNHQWQQAKTAWQREGLSEKDFIEKFYRFIYTPSAEQYGQAEYNYLYDKNLIKE